MQIEPAKECLPVGGSANISVENRKLGKQERRIIVLEIAAAISSYTPILISVLPYFLRNAYSSWWLR